MSTGIEIRELRKTFAVRERGWLRRRSVKTAVDGLDLSIPAGRVTGLLGLNGAGKTTTIKIIATLLRPTTGLVTVDGLDVVAHPRQVRQRINLIAGGERMVYARMTGRENLWYFGQLYDVPRAVLRPRIDELLELVGLTDAAGTVVERYSRGMTQRLSIARGLINDPAYLLLDEPTLGLDAPIARELRRVVARLAAEGRGVLLTSHYLAEVEQLCDHVYVIDQGRHLTAGSPDALKAATDVHREVRVTVTNPSEAIATAATDFAARHGTIAEIAPADGGAVTVRLRHRDDIAGPLATTIVDAGGRLGGLEIAEPSLEDAILALASAGAAGVSAGTGPPTPGTGPRTPVTPRPAPDGELVA